jgi:Tfp pilus assembly protein PilX
MIRSPATHHKHQRGAATLFIAVSLLAILTVVSIFAANVGYFEQRASANEYRHKLAFQAAEAGVNQAIEFLKANSAELVSRGTGGWLFPGSERWIPCSDALPAGMTYDPCSAETDTARRSRMYRYVGTTNGVLPLSEDMQGGGNQTFTSTGGSSALGAGGFTTTYKTYATLCRLDVSSGVPHCSLVPTDEGTFFITIASEGSLENENTTSMLKQSFASFRLLGRQPDAPLIAAGTTTALGSAELVPNPNAGGFGVPISIWAKANADVAGSDFSTCHLGEWLNNVGSGSAPTAEEVVNGVCESCSCSGLRRGFGFLSGKYVDPSGGATRIEGIDILDVESGSTPDVNVDGAKDSTYFPSDLFEYVFGIPDTPAVVAPSPNPKPSGAVKYLTENATQITDCATLGTASSGLFWYTGTSTCNIDGDTGTVTEPVVLVSDAQVKLSGGPRFFGIIYVRDDYLAPGSAFLDSAGGGQVYGAVILEGSSSISGGPQIIFNKVALQNIFNSPKFMRYGTVPGSWSDSVR